MVGFLRRYFVFLFFMTLFGCLGSDQATNGKFLLNENSEGTAYSPPTPIFRDIRIVASANHLTADLPEGNLETFALTLDDATLSSNSGDELSLLADENLQLDLTTDEPAEIASTRLLQDSPYEEVTLTFSSITIEGSFTTNGQTYTFEVNSTEPIETVAAIPEEILTFAASPNLQALAFSKSLEFDLNITLPTLETYQEVVVELQEAVSLYNLSPNETIRISEDSDDPMSQSVRESIRSHFEEAASTKVTKKTKPAKEKEEANEKQDEIEEDGEEQNNSSSESETADHRGNSPRQEEGNRNSDREENRNQQNDNNDEKNKNSNENENKKDDSGKDKDDDKQDKKGNSDQGNDNQQKENKGKKK
ncbi:MAG: hypothetical protein HYT76_04295 [Deltaproteobacteria bacterium]|nr:hypothetical protein [Deltaproteobacteria bacterium]